MTPTVFGNFSFHNLKREETMNKLLKRCLEHWHSKKFAGKTALSHYQKENREKITTSTGGVTQVDSKRQRYFDSTRRGFILNLCSSIIALVAFPFLLPGCKKRLLTNKAGRKVTIDPISQETADKIALLGRRFDNTTLGGDANLRVAHGKLRERIMLAQTYQSLPVLDSSLKQLPQVRWDTNTYTAWVDNTIALRVILEEAKGLSDDVKKKFPEGFKDLEIVGASFVWARQIRPTTTEKADLGEIYWLDIYVERNGFSFPFLTVNWDSVGFIPLVAPFHTEKYMYSALENEQLFLGSMSIVLDWHELAQEFGLIKSIWYTRAVAESNNVDRLWYSTSYDMMIYRPSGVYQGNETVDWPSLPPRAAGDPFENCFPIFDGWAPYDGINREIPLPSDVYLSGGAFTDGQPGATEFVQYVKWIFGNAVEYLGSGQFAIMYDEPPSPPASSHTNRNSEAVTGIAVAKEVATRGGAVVGVGALGGGFAIGVGDAIVASRTNSPERIEQRERILQDANFCVGTSLSEAQCLSCVVERGNYAAEINDIEIDFYLKNGIKVAGGWAVGCVFGGVFALAIPPLGLGILAGCGIAAAAGVGTAALSSINDWTTMTSQIAEQNKNAFHPCRRMSISFDFTDKY